MIDEKFIFTGTAKRRILVTGIIGAVLFVLGFFLADNGGDAHGGDDGHGEGHASATTATYSSTAAKATPVALQTAQTGAEQTGADSTDHSADGEQHEGDADHGDTTHHEGDKAEGHHEEGKSHDGDHKAEGAHHGDGEHHEEGGFAIGNTITHQPHGDGHHGEGHHGEGDHGHAAYSKIQRVFTGLWINNVFWLGLAIIGFLFVALQYAAQAGWSAGMKRIPEAFGAYLPLGSVLLVISFFVVNYSTEWHLFHWLDHSLYDKSSPNYDYILDNKKAYLNMPFFLGRMLIFLAIWFLMYRWLRSASVKEDQLGGYKHWWKMRRISAIFIVFFAVSSSAAAWDWIMSLDPHWFSTMFGWYVFASWFVAGLSAITLIIVYLKDYGYLSIVTQNHLHDLGKFIFAFSIFWTYIWFSQFMLIYYANIPEETVYFWERMNSDNYAPFFYVVLLLNFVFPFLVLMTRDSKRHGIFLKIVCVVVLIGHWLDFYLMITPGTLKENGTFGLMEIGLTMVFGAAFIYIVLNSLSKVNLVAKNHPMLEESLHHDI